MSDRDHISGGPCKAGIGYNRDQQCVAAINELEPLVGKLLKQWFIPLVAIYLVATVSLPSGRIFGYSVKAPLYLVLTPSVFYVFTNKQRHLNRDLSLFIGIPAALAIWLGISQLYRFDPHSALRQYTDIVLTLFNCWLVSVYCEREEGKPLSFLRLLILAETIACTMKVGVIAFALTRGVPVSVVILGLNGIFGANLMDMDIGESFGRIQFASDGLIPICVYAVLRYRERLRLNGLATTGLMVLLILSVLLSFSRYFWGYTCLAVFLGIALGKKDKLFALLVIVFGIAIVTNFSFLSSLVNARFTDEAVGYSDQLREGQVAALDDFFFDAPIFGHGLGSYSTQLTRAADSKYSYEVQLLALTGQLGIVGTALLAGLIVFYLRHLWPPSLHPSAGYVSLIILAIAWVAGGLFNPLLLDPAGAFCYGAILALGKLEPIFAPHRRNSAILMRP